MNPSVIAPVVASWNLPLVLLSYVIAVIGSLVALAAAHNIRRPDGSVSWTNAVAAGVALGGIGVWSMHFIGMLALKLDVATAYSLVETGVSLVAAIIATALALAYVARAPHQLVRLVGAGFMLGMGVVFMHYLGMFGLKFAGYIQWDHALVGASIAIAVVAATAALWLAFNTRAAALRVAAALVMGVAVCSMHYTGMQAAEFICTSADRRALPQGFGYIASWSLGNLVILVALSLAAIIAMDQMLQRSARHLRSPARAA